MSVSALVKLVADTLEVGAAELGPETRFDDLGRTSFQEVELFTALEERFGVTLDFADYTAVTTVGELEAMVTAATGQVP